MKDIFKFVEESLNKSKDYKNVIIESILDFPSLYCVAYSPEKAPKNDFYVDCFVAVDKNNGSLKEYNPLMDMKSFKKASENPVYLRSKDLRRSDSFDKGKELVHSLMR